MYLQETYIYSSRKWILLFLLFIFQAVDSHAQENFDIRLNLNSVDCNTKMACYDVQVRSATGSSWGLAGQNYRLYYDAALAAFQSGNSQLGSDYQQFNLVQDVQDINANGTGSLAFETTLGFLNYSIDLLNTSTGGHTVDGNWLTTSQLCFLMEGDALTNPASCFEVVWSRDGVTNTYATSFVEISEWVQADMTTLSVGVDYQDILSSDANSCLANECTTPPPTSAGEYDIQLTLGDVNCNNNTVCYNVQLKATGSSPFDLAGQNYRLYYNGAIASYLSGTSLLPSGYGNYSLIQDIQNQTATGIGGLSFENNLSFLNYTIDLENITSGGVAVDGNWLTTSQLCFNVTQAAFDDPNTCFEAVWARGGLTDTYATSFIEVSEWLGPNDTEEITGVGFNDLTPASGQVACFNDLCESNTSTPTVGQFDIQLSLNNADCAIGLACYDVQVRSNAATNLAGQNYRLYYDATLGAYASGVSLLPTSDYGAFDLVQNINNQNANGTGNLSFENTLSFLNYTIDLSDTDAGGLPLNGDWLTTSQLCFNLERKVFEDPDICFEAIWAREGRTNEYATSFVEVSEWVVAGNTQEMTGNQYIDLDSSNPDACPQNNCAAIPNFGVQLTPNSCDCNTNTVCYDVQLRSTDGNTINLGGQNYRLYYNSSLAAYQSGTSILPNQYTNFQLEQDIQDVNANGTGNIPFESTLGFLNYSMDLNDVQNGGIDLPSDGSWITTSVLCFDVAEAVFADPTKCFDALWGRLGVTDEYATSFVEVAEWIGSNQTIETLGSQHIDLTENNCFIEKATVHTTINEAICEGEQYEFNGRFLTETGSYIDTLSGLIACDSIVTVDLIVNTIEDTTINETICEGDSYPFNGQDYTTSGTYTMQTTANNCTSTTTLNLTVTTSASETINETICEGDSYPFNGQDYTTSGTYTMQTTANNCTSTTTLNLTVTPSASETINETICEGDSYPFNGQDYTTSGTYTMQTTTNNCTSTTTLNLRVTPSASETINETICEGDSYPFNGQDYTTSGTYTMQTTANNCTSTTTLNLRVTPSASETINETICEGDSYPFNGQDYTTSGTYTMQTTANSCTSTTTLNLTVSQLTRETINETICEGEPFLFNGQSYNAAGTYTVTTITDDSCPKITTLNLTLLTGETTIVNETICQGESYTLNGETYTDAGTYTLINPSNTACDGETILNLNVELCVDLALTKNLASGQSDTVRLGDLVDYQICVINEGLTAAYNVLVTDHIPAGLAFSEDNTDWIVGTDNSANHLIVGPINTGEQVCSTIRFEIAGAVTGFINNIAEIASATDEQGISIADIDSKPETDTEIIEEDDEAQTFVYFNACPDILISPLDAVICKGNSVSIKGIGGSPAAVYKWLEGSNMSCTDCQETTVSPVETSNYSIIVTEANGCTAIGTTTVTVLPQPIVALNDQEICAGGSIQLVTGFTNGFFQWSTSDGSSVSFDANPIVSPTTTTTYCVTVVEENGCQANDCMTVSVKETIQTTLDETICAGRAYAFNGQFLEASGTYTATFVSSTGCDSLVTLNLIVTPATTTEEEKTLCTGASFIYQGTEINAPGNYSFVLTTENGCEQLLLLTVVEKECVDLSLSKELANSSITEIHLGDIIDYTICVTNEGVSPTYQVEIVDHIPNGMVLTPQNSAWTLLAAQKAVYTIPGPILSTESACIDIQLRLEEYPTGELIIKNIAEVGKVVDIQGNTLGDFDSTPEDDTSIDEEFELEDDEGLAAITFNPCPSPVIMPKDPVICPNTDIVLTATGGSDNATYEWLPTTGLSCSNCATPTATPSESIIYCVTITELNGCSETYCTAVSLLAPAIVNVGNNQTICQGTSTTLQASGGLNYRWSPITHIISRSDISNPIVAPESTTVYEVFITDQNGCTDFGQVTVTVDDCTSTPNNPCSLQAVACEDKTICADDPDGVRLVVNGGQSWQWSPNAGLDNPTSPAPYANPTATTVYTVIATDANGCTATDQVVVDIIECEATPNPCNLVAVACPDKQICEGDQIRLVVNGGSSWLWTPSTGLDNPLSDAPYAAPSTTTSYTIVVTDNTGCTSEDVVVVFVNDCATPDPCLTFSTTASADQTICSGDAATISVSGGSNWLWTPTNALNNPTSQSPVATPLTTTTYTVQSTDVSGCVAVDQVTVFVENTVSVFAGNDMSICQGFSGQLQASGASNYKWSPVVGLNNPNIANPSVNPVATTTYTVLTTSANGCTATDQVRVEVKSNHIINAGVDVNICNGSSTQLQAIGGTFYTWSPTTGLSNPSISNPVANPAETTTYCVTITSENGCITTDCLTVHVHEPAVAVACEDKDICFNGAVQLIVTSGASYQWSPAATLDNPFSGTPMANPAHTTTYYVTVTDENGCTSVDDVTVNVGSTATNLGPDKTICSGTSVPLSVSNRGVSYQWSPSTGLNNPTIENPIVTPLSTTSYCVTTTDALGCTATDCININVINGRQAIACEDKQIRPGESIRLNVTTGASYLWSPSASLDDPTSPVPVASPTSTTTYTVTVTDANGCTSQDEVTVYVRFVRDALNEVLVRTRAFLQGPMEIGENLMKDKLREKRYIPLKEPYTDLVPFEGGEPCFIHTGNGGGEVTTQRVLEVTGKDAIVDWVFLELHEAETPEEVIATRAALLQRDGDIVEVDGLSPVTFSVEGGQYFIAVRHRNHLGAMSGQPLNFSNTTVDFDFTDGNQAIYQLKEPSISSRYPVKKIGDVSCLWGGDSNADRRIIFQGPALDQDKLFFDIYSYPKNINEGGIPNFNYIIRDYCLGDNNMDGELKYQGPDNDVDELQFFNIILHEENSSFLSNKIIYEQIPRK